jgi:cell division septation protein DedD
MNNNESGFSLIIVVIFMSIAALFVGYIMGSWLISFMTEESEQQIADNDVEQVEELQEVSSNESAADNQVEINEESTQENALNEETNQITGEQNTETVEEQTAEDSQFEGNDLSGTFAVQIGAFNNIDSAISLREEMKDLGFEAFITESQPHKIRVGSFETREEAEEVEAQLESRDYEGFIVLRD